jgi:hypothetical protein
LVIGVIALFIFKLSGLAGAAVLILTPLFQINLLPCLTQVNFLPLAFFVMPDLEHVLPGFGVAAFTGVARDSRRITASPIPTCRRMA